MPIGFRPLPLVGPPVLAAGTAAFTLTGRDALFSASMVCAPASFVLSGQDAHRRDSVAAAPASFTLAGQAVLFPQTFVAEAASYTLAGQAANMAFPSAGAAFTLTGQPILYQQNFVAGAGPFVLAGQDAGMFPTTNFPVDGAAFVLTGNAAGHVSTIGAGVGAFALTGNAVTGALVMTAAPAAFTLSGQAAGYVATFVCATGTFSVVGWEIADIAGPSGDHIFLVEVQGHNGSSLTTYYLATDDFTSAASDTPANQWYDSRVIDPGNFSRSLGMDGAPSSAAGDVVVASGDPGNGETLDAFHDLGFGRRPIIIKALPRFATTIAGNAVTLFNGTIDRISSTRPLDQIEFQIHDVLADLQFPLLTTRYAGTTTSSAATAEGNADLKGQVKQRVWGAATNVSLQPANVYDLIYLASNSAVVSIALYDGGVALTNAGDYASIALLRAAVIAPGSYATCLALGLVRVGATPVYALTADVVEGANAAARTAAQIAYRMLVAFGIDVADINALTFTSLDTKNAAVCYAVVNDDTQALDAINDVLSGIGARLVPNRDGAYEVMRIEQPVSGGSLTFDLELQDISDSLELVDSLPPVYRVILNYAKAHVVQGDADLASSVTTTRRGELASEFRTVIAEDLTILTKHLDAREMTVDTQISAAADAQTEATRLLALHSAARKEYRVAFALADAWRCDPGVSITMTHVRLGMSAGVNGLVIARVDQFANELVALNVWV